MSKLPLSKVIGLLIIMMLLLASCGGNASNNEDNTASNAENQPPTATPFPTFEFVAPTNPPVFNQSAESTDEADDETTDEAVELDSKLVERGLGRYEALECGICHGANGEGTDEIGGLIELTLSQDNFITFMRTGGSIGSSHQYSTDRLSENGAKNLYQYLLSLSQDS